MTAYLPGVFPRCHPDDEAPRQGTCCWLLAYCVWWHTESDQSCSTFSVTTYPFVLLCVAQETWLLHTKFGNEKFAHWHWPSTIGWLGMLMMIAKAHMRGLWEACRCCCCCVLFTLYVSLPFHFRFTLISFHTARHIEAFDMHWCLLCRYGFVMRSPGSWLGGSRVSALRLFCLAPLGHL